MTDNDFNWGNYPVGPHTQGRDQDWTAPGSHNHAINSMLDELGDPPPEIAPEYGEWGDCPMVAQPLDWPLLPEADCE